MLFDHNARPAEGVRPVQHQYTDEHAGEQANDDITGIQRQAQREGYGDQRAYVGGRHLVLFLFLDHELASNAVATGSFGARAQHWLAPLVNSQPTITGVSRLR